MTNNIYRAAEIVDRLRLDSGPGDMSTAEHIARALADAGLLAAADHAEGVGRADA